MPLFVVRTTMTKLDDMKSEAEQDEQGELVHEKEIQHSQGHTVTEETNLSKLLNPGKRTTGDVNILLHEARQAEEDGVDNPAFPADADTTNEAVPKIKAEGLEPAWKGHESGEEDYI